MKKRYYALVCYQIMWWLDFLQLKVLRFLRDRNEVIGETVKMEMEECLSFVIYRFVLCGFSALGDYAHQLALF